MKIRCSSVRLALLPALLLGAMVYCGCIKSKTVVIVNKDGSGNIVVTKAFSRESADMINAQMGQMARQMAMQMGGDASVEETQKDPFFNEKQIRRNARKFGSSVKYVKARKIETGGMRGYVAVYSFKDVNEIFLDMEKMGEDIQRGAMMDYSFGGNEDSEDSSSSIEKAEKAVEFKMSKTTPGKLEITVPVMSDMAEAMGADADADEGDDTAKKDDEENEKEEYMEDAMMSSPFGGFGGLGGGTMMPSMFIGVGNEEEAAKRMYKGMEFAIAVEINGDVTKTTSSHVDQAKKNRIILMDMNASKIMASPKGSKMMQRSGRYGGGLDRQLFGAMNKVPGAVLETNRLVVVDFK